MGADTGIGLTASEFYNLGTGTDDLRPDPRGFWTPNYSGAGYVVIPLGFQQMPELTFPVTLEGTTQEIHLFLMETKTIQEVF